jgi:uncharacterized protein YndB with AHSA1/START domain
MALLDFSRTVAAPAEVLFEVLADHRGMAAITRFRKVELEREGTPPPNGVGAIRVLHLAGPPVREEITAFEPPRLLSYRLLSGLPVRDHRGTIRLEPVVAGTRMSYLVETEPTLGPASPLALALLRRAVEEIASGIAAEAERRAG